MRTTQHVWDDDNGDYDGTTAAAPATTSGLINSLTPRSRIISRLDICTYTHTPTHAHIYIHRARASKNECRKFNHGSWRVYKNSPSPLPPSPVRFSLFFSFRGGKNTGRSVNYIPRERACASNGERAIGRRFASDVGPGDLFSVTTSSLTLSLSVRSPAIALRRRYSTVGRVFCFIIER